MGEHLIPHFSFLCTRRIKPSIVYCIAGMGGPIHIALVVFVVLYVFTRNPYWRSHVGLFCLWAQVIH